MTIRVVLVDDQALIRAGLTAVLSCEPDIDVVGEAATGRDAVEQVRHLRPDVVLMDIRMPESDGLWATEQITADPALADVRVVVLTTYEHDEYTFRALRAGAAGFLGKGADPALVSNALRAVLAGDRLLSPRATLHLVRRFLDTPGDQTGAAPTTADLDVLTDREREVVALVAAGLSTDDIAARLVISPLTARTHVNRAITKTGVRDRVQLVVLAYRCGLVRP